MSTPCCPPGSWGACAAPQNYVNKGKIEDLGEKLKAYIVKPESLTDPTKALLVSTDIFGIESGRVKAICDDMANKLGCIVVMPMYLECLAGAWLESWGMPNSPWYNMFWFLPWLYRTNLNKCGPLIDTELLPYLQKQGVTEFAAMSFCWGATVGAYVSALTPCKGHVGFHPSYNVLKPSFGPSQEQVLAKLQCKQLYLVGKEDVMFPECEQQKIVQTVAKQECNVILFENQRHGWVNRGDVTNAQVKADVELALEQAETFLKQCFGI